MRRDGRWVANGTYSAALWCSTCTLLLVLSTAAQASVTAKRRHAIGGDQRACNIQTIFGIDNDRERWVGSGKWEAGPKNWWDVGFSNKREVELVGGGLSTLLGGMSPAGSTRVKHWLLFVAD